MQVRVECYSGAKSDERPVRFQLDDRDYFVDEVIDQWYGPNDTFFKIRAGVRDRINTTNNAFVNAAGQRRLKIHPRCKELIKDLLWMRWRRDVAGNTMNELDKSNPQRSHSSDALQYLVAGELAMKSQVGWQPGRIL